MERSDGEPRADLDPPFSDAAAAATPWSQFESVMQEAGVYWLVSVRRDGRPHVTPVAGAWVDSTFYFSTGNGEQKAKNIQSNPQVAVVTGCNDFASGLDAVVEGEAVAVSDASRVEQLAKVLNEKYDNFFDFSADGAHFAVSGGGTAAVYMVERSRAFAYGRGDTYSATRYR